MLIDPYWAGFRAVQPGNRNILPAEWTLHSIPRDGSDDVLVVEHSWSSFRGAGSTALARLNTHEPTPRRLSIGTPDGAQHWLTDERGNPGVVQTVLDGKRSIHRRGKDGAWQELASFDYPGSGGALGGWGPRFPLDGELFVAGEATGTASTQLRLFDSASGARGRNRS